jgi:transcriptional regulator with XRE-family HTH domain
MIGDSPSGSNLAPSHLTKQQFGKRVYQLMLSKGWRQSELARQSGLPRDSISVYVRGKSLPTPTSLAALAKALGVAPEELLPNHIEGAIDADMPAIEMKVSPNAPNIAWLRVNRLVTVESAMKIMDILANDNAVDAGK